MDAHHEEKSLRAQANLQSSLLDRPFHPCHLFCLVVVAFVECLLHVVIYVSCCPFSMSLLSMRVLSLLLPWAMCFGLSIFVVRPCLPSLQKNFLCLSML